MGGSGSAAIVPNSGTLRTIIETMKKSAKALYRWFAVGVAGLFLTTANVTTVIPPTFEEMTDRAELVFVGKVVSSRAEWRTVGTNRVISARWREFFSCPVAVKVLEGEAAPARAARR